MSQVERIGTDGAGFEPAVPFGTQAFQACAIDHSATHPRRERQPNYQATLSCAMAFRYLPIKHHCEEQRGNNRCVALDDEFRRRQPQFAPGDFFIRCRA